MNIKVTTRALGDQAQAVDVEGEIDVHTAPRLKEVVNRLIEDGHHRLLINLEKVKSLDSSGLGTLIGTLKKLRDRQGRLRLHTNEHLQRFFELSGMVKIFEMVPGADCWD